MIRAVLAVLVAVALLGIAQPVIDDARATHSEEAVRREFGTLTSATTTLVAEEDPVPAGTRGARRVVTITVPDRSIASAPVEYVAIGGVPDGNATHDTRHSDVIGYRIRNRPPRVLRMDVDVRVAARRNGTVVGADSRPLVLREDGRITLTLVNHDGRRIVLVERG